MQSRTGGGEGDDGLKEEVQIYGSFGPRFLLYGHA